MIQKKVAYSPVLIITTRLFSKTIFISEVQDTWILIIKNAHISGKVLERADALSMAIIE